MTAKKNQIPARLVKIGLPLFLVSLAVNIWWPLSHNFINNSCPNFIYRSQHLSQCAQWDLSSSIVTWLTMPVLIIGLFGALAGIAIWTAIRMDGDA